MSSLSDLKAAYRLLAEVEVTHRAVLATQWQQTRAQARKAPVVVLVQDPTELDYTAHPPPGTWGQLAMATAKISCSKASWR